MATSSITHNFFITDPAAVERFVQALEESEEEAKHRPPTEPVGRILTDPRELATFASKIKAQLKTEGKV
ncbi:MAG: hypothetical protein IJ849_05110 [Selenomonadaceae bacterium]|nr:hypothetical protein [Selenomonadaceae bacterium]